MGRDHVLHIAMCEKRGRKVDNDDNWMSASI